MNTQQEIRSLVKVARESIVAAERIIHSVQRACKHPETEEFESELFTNPQVRCLDCQKIL